MSARDELVQIIWDVAVADRVKDGKDLRNVPVVRPKVESMADAIIAAGYRKPRTITTAEELDALPDGSAVLDAEGDVLTKHAHWWHSYETAPLLPRKVAKYGPLTVIHEGA